MARQRLNSKWTDSLSEVIRAVSGLWQSDGPQDSLIDKTFPADREKYWERSLEESGLLDDGLIEFVPTAANNEPSKSAVDISVIDSWNSIEGEILDFLEENKSHEFDLKLISAISGMELPGHFGIYPKQVFSEILAGCKGVFAAAKLDKYPLRIEFHSDGVNRYEPKCYALIRNYDNKGRVGTLCWEEFKK